MSFKQKQRADDKLRYFIIMLYSAGWAEAMISYLNTIYNAGHYGLTRDREQLDKLVHSLSFEEVGDQLNITITVETKEDEQINQT